MSLETRITPVIFTVNTLDDTSDADLNNGTPSDANGNVSLRAAVEQSNFRGKGDVWIEFDIGLADQFGKISLELTDTVNITVPVDINGDFGGSGFVRITGDDVFVLFHHQAAGGAFNNLYMHDADAGEDFGGAVYNSGNLGIYNCTFVNNQSGKGGAIYNAGDSFMTIGECSFSSNHTSNEGGAISTATDATINIYYSSFYNNWSVKGGALASNGADTHIEYCTFQDNYSVTGGAVYMSSGELEALDSQFTSNTASELGGAIYCTLGYVVINETNFNSNIAGIDGGAIRNVNGEFHLDTCKFTGNSAAKSGHCIANSGIQNVSVWLFMSNCTLQGNLANDVTF